MVRERLKDTVRRRAPRLVAARDRLRAWWAPPTEPGRGDPARLAEIEAVLDAWVRPGLAEDGGNIEVVRAEGGVVSVRLVGACASCASSTATLRLGVERVLREELPGFTELVAVGPA
jgi:Fe-S cluster biogenesis protein NfuA